MSKATPGTPAAPDPKPAKRATGRPVLWTLERRTIIVNLVCEAIANGGTLLDVCPRILLPEQLLSKGCDVPDARPSAGQFLYWLMPDAPAGGDFSELYARAKELRVTHDEEQLRRSAFDGENDLTFTANGWQTNSEVIQRSKLIVDTLKWTLERRRANLYGPRVDVTSDGQRVGAVAMPGYVPLGAPLDAADVAAPKQAPQKRLVKRAKAK